MKGCVAMHQPCSRDGVPETPRSHHHAHPALILNYLTVLSNKPSSLSFPSLLFPRTWHSLAPAFFWATWAPMCTLK